MHERNGGATDRESEIGEEDHPFNTSVLPKSFASSSNYHTSNSKRAHGDPSPKGNKDVLGEESISEYYLESSRLREK